MVLFSNIQIANSAAQSNVRWMRVLQSGIKSLSVKTRPPEEEEFEEEEEPQEEKDDIEVNIEEDKNEPELTYPYEEVDPLNPPPPASESEPEDAIEVENPIEHEDEAVPANVYEVGKSSTAPFLREDNVLLRLCGREMAHALVEKKGKAKDEYYGKLILDLGNEVRSNVEQGTATMEKLVKVVMGFVLEERPNEAIDVPIKDEKSPSYEPRGSSRDAYEILQLIHRFLKERWNYEDGSRDLLLHGGMLRYATMGFGDYKQMLGLDEGNCWTVEFCPREKVQRMEHERWNLKVKEYNIVAYSQRFNELALMCPRMVDQKE
ncbi:hypothetical protein Tco_1246975 [Tanacetum coccineum]